MTLPKRIIFVVKDEIAEGLLCLRQEGFNMSQYIRNLIKEDLARRANARKLG